MQRHDVASTLRRRYIYVMCPLGIVKVRLMMDIPAYPIYFTMFYRDSKGMGLGRGGVGVALFNTLVTIIAK